MGDNLPEANLYIVQQGKVIHLSCSENLLEYFYPTIYYFYYSVPSPYHQNVNLFFWTGVLRFGFGFVLIFKIIVLTVIDNEKKSCRRKVNT